VVQRELGGQDLQSVVAVRNDWAVVDGVAHLCVVNCYSSLFVKYHSTFIIQSH
jgi:3-methyladenine DNA glycosylase AlkD